MVTKLPCATFTRSFPATFTRSPCSCFVAMRRPRRCYKIRFSRFSKVLTALTRRGVRPGLLSIRWRVTPACHVYGRGGLARKKMRPGTCTTPSGNRRRSQTDPVLSVQTEQALGQLEPLDRDLLKAAFYGGHTHKELAENFELPLGTVKTRVRRALLTLRGYWEGS